MRSRLLLLTVLLGACDHSWSVGDGGHLRFRWQLVPGGLDSQPLEQAAVASGGAMARVDVDGFSDGEDNAGACRTADPSIAACVFHFSRGTNYNGLSEKSTLFPADFLDVTGLKAGTTEIIVSNAGVDVDKILVRVEDAAKITMHAVEALPVLMAGAKYVFPLDRFGADGAPLRGDGGWGDYPDTFQFDQPGHYPVQARSGATTLDFALDVIDASGITRLALVQAGKPYVSDASATRTAQYYFEFDARAGDRPVLGALPACTLDGMALPVSDDEPFSPGQSLEPGVGASVPVGTPSTITCTIGGLTASVTVDGR